MDIITNRTDRNRTTRMKIGESILGLLKRTPLAEIRISAIAQQAGISRMTFYHYYETKEAALKDYLSEIIMLYVNETREKGMDHLFHTAEDLEFTLCFFAHYKEFLLTLDKAGCYNILIDGVNDYLETYQKPHFSASIYHLYYYAGAILNVFMNWLRSGQKESPAEIANLILSESLLP